MSSPYSSEKSRSVEQRLNSIIGLIYADGANQVSIGTGAQGQDLQIYDLGGAPAAPSSGTKLWSNAGKFNMVSEDGNNYALGHVLLRTTTDQTGFGTTNSTIAGLSLALPAGLCRISGMITVTNAGTGTQTFAIGTSGAAMANMRVGVRYLDLTNNVDKGGGQITTQGTRVGTNSGNAAGVNAMAIFDGILNVSSAGTFNMTAGIAAGGTTPMTVNGFSYIVYHF